MPTIIDSLFIELGWDLRGFRSGEAEIAKGRKKASDEATATGKTVEAGAKRQREAFNSVKGELLGLAAVFTAGLGVKEFVAGQITGAAATGRLAHNLNVSTEELSAWQGVLRRAGGTTQDANSDLQTLVGTFEQIRLTGQSPLIPYLNLLGVSLKDLEDPTGTLLKLSDAFQKMDPRLSAKLGADMGLSPAMISTLQKGRTAVTGLLEEQRRLGVITAEDARQAQTAQDAIEGLKDSSSRLGRTILTEVLPALSDFSRWLSELSVNPTFIASLRTVTELIRGAARDWRLLTQTSPREWLARQDTRRALFGTAADADLRTWEGWRSVLVGDQSRRGASATPVTPGGATGSSQDAMVAFFRDQGWPDAAARGMAAGIMAESRGDPNAYNSAGGGRGAQGIGQWRGKRLDDFQRVIGRPVQGSSLNDQLRFMQWELNNTERGAGAAIYGAGSETGSLSAYINRFMRPATGSETTGDLSRGARALAQQSRGGTGGSTTVNITGVTVNTRATDAQGVARDFGRHVRSTVVAANNGVL